jgi:small-conductance mechanosensitive channel
MSCGSFFGRHKGYIGYFGKIAFSYLGNICSFYIFPLNKYCMAIAIIGLIVTTMDIYRVLVDGPKLSDQAWPKRPREKEMPISEESERDVKLVTAVVEWTIYLCLMFGTYYNTAMFLLPWLWMKLFILISSVFVCFVKLIRQKTIVFSLLMILGRLLEVHNVLYVSCLFKALYTK